MEEALTEPAPFPDHELAVGSVAAALLLMGLLLYERRHHAAVQSSPSSRLEESPTTAREHSAQTSNQRHWQQLYLLIYSMLVAADWVQGPYMYRLYQAYGFTLAQNGQLFIAGFASSMVFGTVAGTLADRFGRKRGTILYTLVYGLSCLTKHARDFPTLMVGRILGGLATSLLFTVPESWVVAEHGRRRLSDSTLTALFADMSVINGLTAIGAGWLAEGAVAAAQHPVGAFDLSLVLLILGGLAVSLCWSENFGDQTVGVVGHLWEGMATVTSSPQLSALAAVQSIFEAAMYVFVFLYTPALQRVAGRDDLPFGTLFACLMVAVAMGGGLAKLLLSYGKWTASRLLVVVMLGAAVACAGLALASSTHQFLGAMLAFEVLVGMYWPCISTVRSRLIPEALRATILNLFRVPLNVFVCTALLGIDQWPESVTLGLCGAALMGGSGIALMLQCGQPDKVKAAAPSQEPQIQTKALAQRRK